MKAAISVLLVLALAAIAWVGADVLGARILFGVIIPYLAAVVFVVGVVARILTWARAPVPFRIPTTAGQQKTLPWLGHSKLDNPATGMQVVGRMLLEVLLFRSLFRNTKARMRAGPRLLYSADKFLWLFALAFHYAFLAVIIRHLRFFIEPVPAWLLTFDSLDGFFQVTVPALHVSTVLIVVALGYLLLRRFKNPQVRTISLVPDYFPLMLLLGIAISGILMRHVAKTDVVGMKELGANLLAFQFSVPAGIGVLAIIHLFLVSTLAAYFPFSKLVHAPGVFLSPTRNLANNNRAVRHVNPWNRDVAPHAFEDWKEEFAKEIADAGYELERAGK